MIHRITASAGRGGSDSFGFGPEFSRCPDSLNLGSPGDNCGSNFRQAGTSAKPPRKSFANGQKLPPILPPFHRLFPDRSCRGRSGKKSLAQSGARQAVTVLTRGFRPFSKSRPSDSPGRFDFLGVRGALDSQGSHASPSSTTAKTSFTKSGVTTGSGRFGATRSSSGSPSAGAVVGSDGDSSNDAPRLFRTVIFSFVFCGVTTSIDYCDEISRTPVTVASAFTTLSSSAPSTGRLDRRARRGC